MKRVDCISEIFYFLTMFLYPKSFVLCPKVLPIRVHDFGRILHNYSNKIIQIYHISAAIYPRFHTHLLCKLVLLLKAKNVL